MNDQKKTTVIDCTLRDGGLMNNSHFSLETVQAVYKSLSDAGVDIVEVGYKNSKKQLSDKVFGTWRFCEEADLRKVVGEKNSDTKTKLSVMIDAHKGDIADLLPKEKSVIDVVRIATYDRHLDTAIEFANRANELGYETFINIMAVTTVEENMLAECLQRMDEETKITAAYIVDSFGNLYEEDVTALINTFKKYIKTKELGVHCHNNQQLAFSNTIHAIKSEVTYADATLYGMGRGAGNCPTELLLKYLNYSDESLKRIVEVIGKYILPIQKEIYWGYAIPFYLTGILNQHPDVALSQMKLPEDSEDKYDFRKFFEKLQQTK